MNRTKIITLVTATALVLTLTSCQAFANTFQEVVGPETTAHDEPELPVRDTDIVLDTPEKAVEWLTEPTRGQENAPVAKIFSAPYSLEWVVYLQKEDNIQNPYPQKPTINDCAYVDSYSKNPLKVKLLNLEMINTGAYYKNLQMTQGIQKWKVP